MDPSAMPSRPVRQRSQVAVALRTQRETSLLPAPRAGDKIHSGLEEIRLVVDPQVEYHSSRKAEAAASGKESRQEAGVGCSFVLRVGAILLVVDAETNLSQNPAHGILLFYLESKTYNQRRAMLLLLII